MGTAAARSMLRRLLVGAVIAGALALGGAACGDDETPAGQGSPSAAARTDQSPLDADAFAAAVARPGVTVVDVRTADEFTAGHLAGAVNIDVQDPAFAETVARLDRAGTYAVYCHSGNRSAVAVSYLRSQGFSSVIELQGGIAAWEAAGRPITTG